MKSVSPPGLITLSFLAKAPNRHRGRGHGCGPPPRGTTGSALAFCATVTVLAAVCYTFFCSTDARGGTDGDGNVDGTDDDDEDNACYSEAGGGGMKAIDTAGEAVTTTTATDAPPSSSSSPSAVAAKAAVPNDSEVQAAILHGAGDGDEEGEESLFNRPHSTFVDPTLAPIASNDEVMAGGETTTTAATTPQSTGDGGGGGGPVVANAACRSRSASKVIGATGRLSKTGRCIMQPRRSSSCSSSSSSRAERRAANRERLDRSIQRHAERIIGAARSKQRPSEGWVECTTVTPPRTAGKEKRHKARGNDEPAPLLFTRIRNGEKAYSICGKSNHSPSFERHVADRAHFCPSSFCPPKLPKSISATGRASTAYRHDAPSKLTMPNPPLLSTSERRGEKVYSSSSVRSGNVDRSVSTGLVSRSGSYTTGLVQKCSSGRPTVPFHESATNQISSPSVRHGSTQHLSKWVEENLQGAASKTVFLEGKQEKERDQAARILMQTLDPLACHAGHLQSEERYFERCKERSEERKRRDDKKLVATVWHGSTPTQLVAEKLSSSQTFTTKRSDADPTDLLEFEPKCDDRNENHESSVVRATMAEGDSITRE